MSCCYCRLTIGMSYSKVHKAVSKVSSLFQVMTPTNHLSPFPFSLLLPYISLIPPSIPHGTPSESTSNNLHRQSYPQHNEQPMCTNWTHILTCRTCSREVGTSHRLSQCAFARGGGNCTRRRDRASRVRGSQQCDVCKGRRDYRPRR